MGFPLVLPPIAAWILSCPLPGPVAVVLSSYMYMYKILVLVTLRARAQRTECTLIILVIDDLALVWLPSC